MPTDERATGLILRTRPLTETSLIVHWLTITEGRLSTVAKGARRPKSSYRGKLDLFYTAEFSFYRSRRSDLHNLKEIRVIRSYQAVRTDISKLRQAAYAATLITQTTENDTPMPGLFEIFRDLLEELESHPWKAWSVLILEIKLLALHGLSPRLADSSLSPGCQAIYQRMTSTPWPHLNALQLTPAQFNELNRFLQKFLAFHFEHFPKSRQNALDLDG